MPREIGPTLVKTVEIGGLAAAAGGTEVFDFDFAMREGARLLGVEYLWVPTAGTSQQMSAGIYLGPSRDNPTSYATVWMDEDVVATIGHMVIQEAIGEQHFDYDAVDLSMYSIIITRNVTLAVFNASASGNLAIKAKIYYNRIELSADEAVVIMTLRR